MEKVFVFYDVGSFHAIGEWIKRLSRRLKANIEPMRSNVLYNTLA